MKNLPTPAPQGVLPLDGAPKDLKALAAAINHEHSVVEGHMLKGAAAALRAGELLLKAKKQVNHGEWAAWADRNCVFKERTRQGYQKLARFCREHPSMAAELVSGSFTKALRSLPVAAKSATVADLDDGDDEQVEEAEKHAEPVGLAKRLSSDAEKVLGVLVSVYDLGKAIERAPRVEEWLDHAQPHHVEQLARFMPAIVKAFTVLADEMKVDLTDKV